MKFFKNGYDTAAVVIYVDDIEAYYVNDALERMFDNMIESIKDDIIVELEDEGYEYEDTEAVT